MEYMKIQDQQKYMLLPLTNHKGKYIKMKSREVFLQKRESTFISQGFTSREIMLGIEEK